MTYTFIEHMCKLEFPVDKTNFLFPGKLQVIKEYKNYKLTR